MFFNKTRYHQTVRTCRFQYHLCFTITSAGCCFPAFLSYFNTIFIKGFFLSRGTTPIALYIFGKQFPTLRSLSRPTHIKSTRLPVYKIKLICIFHIWKMLAYVRFQLIITFWYKIFYTSSINKTYKLFFISII